jgi:ADP-sugar diphosphatase
MDLGGKGKSLTRKTPAENKVTLGARVRIRDSPYTNLNGKFGKIIQIHDDSYEVEIDGSGSEIQFSHEACEVQTTIRVGSNEVVVTAEFGIDAKKAVEAKAFKEWSSAIAMENHLSISSIHIQSLDMFGSKVGFIKCKVDASKDGKMVPGIVLLRGGAPAILVILHCKKKKYTVLVRQVRLPVCKSSMLEIPAGMMGSEGSFAGAAAKKLKEECGIQIEQKDMINMSQLAQKETHPGVYASCGGSDEFNPIFLYQKVVTEEELSYFDNRLHGVAEQGEEIRLQILPLGKLWRRSPDSKALSAVCLYERLTACGRIPEFISNAE